MNQAFVEDRRIRTWEQEGPARRERRWLLVAKAQFMRYRRSWVFWGLFATGVLLALGNLLGAFASMDDGGGIGVELYLVGYAFPAMWLLGTAMLLAAAPAIADDIRFDAPLFYFSRPLLVRDYLVGKLAFVVALFGMLVLPAALVMSLVGVATWGADGPEPPDPGDYRHSDPIYYQDALARHHADLPYWHATHMDSFGDWLFTTLALLLGVSVSILFLASLTLAVSSHTERGWHAAIALIVVLAALGMIGMALGDLLAEGTMVLAFSPTAWPYAATILPIERYYLGPGDDPWGHYRNAAATAVLAYAAMALATAGFLALTMRRLRRLGGAI